MHQKRQGVSSLVAGLGGWVGGWMSIASTECKPTDMANEVSISHASQKQDAMFGVMNIGIAV